MWGNIIVVLKVIKCIKNRKKLVIRLVRKRKIKILVRINKISEITLRIIRNAKLIWRD